MVLKSCKLLVIFVQINFFRSFFKNNESRISIFDFPAEMSGRNEKIISIFHL